jgi:hypothetical protein
MALDNDIVEKMREVKQKIERAHGPFTFFAVVTLDESQRWNVLVAAPWLDDGQLPGIRIVVSAMSEKLTLNELIDFGKVLIAEPGSRVHMAFTKRVLTFNDDQAVRGEEIGGLDIDEGHIFRTEPKPELAAVRR